MPCNLEPSTKRHKAQARIALLFVLIALALTALPTASFAGTDTAGNVLATEADSNPSIPRATCTGLAKALTWTMPPSAAILSPQATAYRFATAPQAEPFAWRRAPSISPKPQSMAV